MRALVLCDDKWHPARVARAGLAPLSDRGWEWDWIEDAGDWSAKRMAEYRLVVLTKANNVSSTDDTPWMTPEVETSLRDYARSGNGILAIHSGTAGYRTATGLRALLGGIFISHPPQCSVTVEPHTDHPLAAGVAPFTVWDEHYGMEVDDPTVEHVLTTRSEHGTQPGGWTRREAEGRICVLTPGHNLEVWLQPAYQQLIDNALRWCYGTE